MKTASLLAVGTLVLFGCSSQQPAPAPSQPESFCSSARAFNAATLQAAKQAAENGSITNGTLGNEYSALVAPLQQLQTDLPADAPAEVRAAITAYLSELANLSSGSVSSQPVITPAPTAVPEPTNAPQQPAPTAPTQEGIPEELLQEFPEDSGTKAPEGAIAESASPHSVPSGLATSADAQLQVPATPSATASLDTSTPIEAPGASPPVQPPTSSQPEAASPPAASDPAMPASAAPDQLSTLLTWQEAGSLIAGYIRSQCPPVTSSTPW